MATTPDTVTHAFSLNDPSLAWLILHGHKIIENRDFRIAPGWYGVAVTATAYTSVVTEIALQKEHKRIPGATGLRTWNGHVVGVCKVGYSLPAVLAKKNRWYCAPYNVANVITDYVPFLEPVKARGNFGTWPLKESQGLTQLRAKSACNVGGLKKTDAEKVLPPQDDVWERYTVGGQAKEAKGGQGKRPAEEAAEAQAAGGAAVKKAKPPPGPVAERPKAAAPVKGDDIRGYFGKK